MVRALLLIIGLIFVGFLAYKLFDYLWPKQSEKGVTASLETSVVDSQDVSREALPVAPDSAQVATRPKRLESGSPADKVLPSDLLQLEHLQASGARCQPVHHKYYALCYDEAHEQARWTVYVLSGANLKRGHWRRTQDFRPDPFVSTGSAQLSDYRRSGYDRGHLVPAGDFKWDSLGMSETFYLSNTSPQLHGFNAGIWEALERAVRGWAKQKGRLVVYTGPVLRPNQKRIAGRVTVPDSFYKVLYWMSSSRVEALGFLVPHREMEGDPLRYAVSVDVVEQVTGLDFFPVLPDEWETPAERTYKRDSWRLQKR